MKFKARFDLGGLEHFQRACHAIMLMSKTCVIRLARYKIHFVLTADLAKTGVRVWSDLNVGALFETYTVKSQQSDNEILIEVSAELLHQALRLASGAEDVTVKITKQGERAVLAFEIVQSGHHSTSDNLRTISQCIPIIILNHALNATFREPKLPTPEVTLSLPPLKILRPVIDRLKTFGKYIEITASGNGSLSFAVCNTNVDVKVHFHDMENPMLDPQASTQDATQSTTASGTVMVSSRQMAQFVKVASPGQFILSVLETRALMIYELHDDFSLTILLPVHEET